MQLPTKNTPVATCEAASLYTETMCSKFPEDATLMAVAEGLRVGRTALSTSQAAYRAAVLAVLPLRVEVRFVDYLADKRVRQTQRQAELADGKKGGRICSQVFPKGVTPIVKPVGSTEVAELRALEGRLDAVATIWSDAAAQKTELTALRQRYESALSGRQEAVRKVGDLRAARDAAKEDFLDVFAVAGSRIKAEFPRDRVMQDLFFERINARPGTEESEESEEPEEPQEPAAG
jgi:hypothetical protein